MANGESAARAGEGGAKLTAVNSVIDFEVTGSEKSLSLCINLSFTGNVRKFKKSDFF